MPEPDAKLFTEPALLTFGSEELEKFVELLTVQDRHTIATPLDVTEQILLTPDCTTQRGGLQIAATAFRQICRAVCPGLYNVVADVAGLRRRAKDADRDRFSLSDALQIFNVSVRRRFRTCLDGMQSVRDTRTGIIDGIVGRNYRRLPNIELLQKAGEIMRLYKQPVQFHSARVYGRYIVLCYRDLEPFFTIDLGRDRRDTFYSGFYFSNSETGDGSVRATTILTRGRDDNRALGFFGSRGRLIHAGKDFARRFEQLMNSVAEHRPDKARLERGMIALATETLGLGGTDDETERKFVELVHVLRTRQLTNSLAKKIVRGVLVQTGFDVSPVADVRHAKREDWPDRTGYDLFMSMTRVSKSLPITLQERVENLAYAMVVGRFTPNKQ